MKRILYALIILFGFVTIAEASGDPIKNFYRKYKKRDQVFNIALPGVLTRTCIGMARIFVHDEEAKAGLKLARKMKGIRLLVDNGHQIPKAAGKALIKDLGSQSNMETLVSVRENGNYTVVMGQIKGKKIKKIVVIAFEEGHFTMVAVKSRLKIKHVNQLIKALQKRAQKKKDKQKETEKEKNSPMA